MIFGPCHEAFKNRHHVEPRVKLYSPREESFPIPLEYIDVSRTTDTNLDVKREARPWLLEYRWVARLVRSLDRFHTIDAIWRLKDICGPGRDWQEKQLTSRPDHSWPELWESMGKWRSEGEAKVVTWKAPSGERTKIARDPFHRPWRYSQGVHQKCSQEIGNTSGYR